MAYCLFLIYYHFGNRVTTLYQIDTRSEFYLQETVHGIGSNLYTCNRVDGHMAGFALNIEHTFTTPGLCRCNYRLVYGRGGSLWRDIDIIEVGRLGHRYIVGSIPLVGREIELLEGGSDELLQIDYNLLPSFRTGKVNLLVLIGAGATPSLHTENGILGSQDLEVQVTTIGLGNLNQLIVFTIE